MSIWDKFKLNGCCTIVTGGAIGLGRAMAGALAEAGSNIVIADLSLERAEEAAAEISKLGVRAIAIGADVTRPADASRIVEQTLQAFGKIDVLVNNAGIVKNVRAEEMSLEDWNAVMNVNLNGVFVMSQTVGKVMIDRQSGSIINISSMSGIVVNTPQAQCAYNASKAGVIALTKSLASEWAPHRIRVNTIAPGYMKTELTRKFFEDGGGMTDLWLERTPMGRPGAPEELGGIALYLASEASSFATGGVFVIDGGYTVW